MAEAEKKEMVTLTKDELTKLMADTAANAARAAAADVLAKLSDKGENPGADQMRTWTRELSMAMAELSDQGTSRKRVAPEILAARADAGERLAKLLAEARDMADAAADEGDDDEAAKWLPRYRVVAKTYLGDQIVEPWRRTSEKSMTPTEIIWRGYPNNALQPLNEIAQRLFEDYHIWIGSHGKLTTIYGKDGIALPMPTSFVTPGGVVVVGAPPAGSRLDIDDSLRSPDLEIVADPNDPTATHIRVLGTIAEPARQNVVPRRSLRQSLKDDVARRVASRSTGQM